MESIFEHVSLFVGGFLRRSEERIKSPSISVLLDQNFSCETQTQKLVVNLSKKFGALNKSLFERKVFFLCFLFLDKSPLSNSCFVKILFLSSSSSSSSLFFVFCFCFLFFVLFLLIFLFFLLLSLFFSFRPFFPFFFLPLFLYQDE